MKFNNIYRKQSKKTLWDEELDSTETLVDKLNKDYLNNLKPSFDPYCSQSHSKDKICKCNRCGIESEKNQTEIYKGLIYCRACALHLDHYDV
ncbi:hypothetical protein [Neobacillus cucumis]|uniref:hypothetical protein n=1 Tax=Neobacillus cucumis TaxID=1740721 RepID=UPI0028534197|nr:hypothetical protein [Neobacillus cucumis]MDR4950406.1 hypothetical protein [Neobacillus cucumis]